MKGLDYAKKLFISFLVTVFAFSFCTNVFSSETLTVNNLSNCISVDIESSWQKISLPNGTYTVTLTSDGRYGAGSLMIDSGSGNIELHTFRQEYKLIGQSFTYVNPSFIAGYVLDSYIGDNGGDAVFTITGSGGQTTTTIGNITTTTISDNCTYGSCGTTAECTAALGPGWACINGCCEQIRVCPISLVLEGDEASLNAIRSFRDNILRSTPEGREIIKLYYLWSPIFVKAMKDDEAFYYQVKEMVDEVLPMIESAAD